MNFIMLLIWQLIWQHYIIEQGKCWASKESVDGKNEIGLINNHSYASMEDQAMNRCFSMEF